MNGFRTDDESESNIKMNSSNISVNHDVKTTSSNSDKSSRQQTYTKPPQSNTLSDFANAVKSAACDGQTMPGHRFRQKPSSKFNSKLLLSFSSSLKVIIYKNPQ